MKNYELQNTSIWSFPDRGNWSTHKGDYRGNWSPHIPRNLILKYTKINDLILDCFVGSGTTLIEAKLLNRNAIGVDINNNALNISKERLRFASHNSSMIKLYKGDAQKLTMINDDSIDLICTHPPYANIIKYSKDIDNDLSLLEYNDFLLHMNNVSKELYRVLKHGHFCSFMIGDIRKNGDVLPLGFRTMQVFLNNGFILKEIIIKEQHNCNSTKYWKDRAQNLNFYLLAHEYIFVLYKQ
ncbi:Modification methylase MboII [Clostridiales bacterium CHKCI006]|nr:Modification methylase MboII [Clostridiales bacterium CHKCI006]